MNKIETLVKSINFDGKSYSPRVFVTAWNRWCVSYTNILDRSDNLCSVTVEPENEPINIESTKGCINEGIGNTRTLDDAVDMIRKFVQLNYM